VAVSVPVDQLKFWYAGGDATYLVVYLESVDLFIAEDVRDVVDRKWGTSILDDKSPVVTTKTTTVKLSASSVSDGRPHFPDA
jgi:hypothetical protein